EDDKTYYKRYALTESGISPRLLPRVKGVIHHVTGVEHNEEGKTSEAAENRQQQMEKRMRKTEHLLINDPVESDAQNESSDILYLGFISTNGAIQEGKQRLEQQDINVNHLQIRQLHPFPSKTLQETVE